MISIQAIVLGFSVIQVIVSAGYDHRSERDVTVGLKYIKA